MFEQFIISIQIILIDIVMAADNAIIIGMIASGFAKDNRKRIIAWGIAAAFTFRIVFAFGAVYILEFPVIKILGGVLLLLSKPKALFTIDRRLIFEALCGGPFAVFKVPINLLLQGV